jgi:hypothetical protein
MRTIGTSESGAIFSDDMKYRYRLWRCWKPELPRACFILLNPSTADEIANDPTVERQIRRVERWKDRNATLFGEAAATAREFGSLEVVNVCAWRSSDPSALYEVEDPVGDENGEAIHTACESALDTEGIVICGWGTHADKLDAGKYTLHQILLDSLGNMPLCALKLNQDGTPVHPLYLPYDIPPRKWVDGELKEEAI